MAADLQARRHDPTEWEPVEAEPGKIGKAVVTSFRMPAAEFLAMRKAVKASGESMSEFIRRAVALCTEGIVTPISLEVRASAQKSSTQMNVTQPATPSSYTDNRGGSVVEYERVPVAAP